MKSMIKTQDHIIWEKYLEEEKEAKKNYKLLNKKLGLPDLDVEEKKEERKKTILSIVLGCFLALLGMKIF